MPVFLARSTAIASLEAPKRAISRPCGVESVSFVGRETFLNLCFSASQPLHATGVRQRFGNLESKSRNLSQFTDDGAVALERRLSIDHGDEILTILTGDSTTSAAADAPDAGSSSEAGSPFLASPCNVKPQPGWDEIHVGPPMTPTSMPLSFSAFQFPPTPPSPQRSTFVDGLMRADL